MPNKLRIGTRSSELAMWQAKHVQSLLALYAHGIVTELVQIETHGDRDRNSSLAVIGGQGAFTKEIEAALIDCRIDVAVHSLKDLPTTLDPALTLAATPGRASVEDAFIGRDTRIPLLELPIGATIATGSLRRKAQLLALREDFTIVDLRGNVPTRIRKLRESNWDGIILATAGLERLDLAHEITQRIPAEMLVPAVGQGALGLETRRNDDATIGILQQLNDADVFAAVTAERSALRAMGGGCQVPMGANARIIEGAIDLQMVIAHPRGLATVRGRHGGNREHADEVGAELAERLLHEGGQAFLDADTDV